MDVQEATKSPVGLPGLITREQLLELEPFKGKNVRTINRYEAAGMPVIRRGSLRLYDVDAIARWLRGEDQPRRRRARRAA